MTNRIKLPAIALAATIAAAGVPSTASAAAPAFAPMTYGAAQTGVAEGWQHGRHRDWRSGHRHEPSRGYYRQAYDEPVYRNTPVWRGNNGRYYCRKKDGTTGLIIGGAVGALLGREIDGGYNRSLGTILGAAGGALLGRELARGGARCR